MAEEPSPSFSEELWVSELEGDVPELKLVAPGDECAPGDARSDEGDADSGETTLVPVPLALSLLV